MKVFQLKSYSSTFTRSSMWPEKSRSVRQPSQRGRCATSRLPVNSRPFQFCSGVFPRSRQGLPGKCGRAEKLAVHVVGPAVQRADDVLRVAAALEHDGLAMAADVGQQLHAVRVAHQRPRVAHPLERVVVARVGNHQLVADVAGAAVEEHPLLELVELRIEIPVDGELRGGLRKRSNAGQVGHAVGKLCGGLAPPSTAATEDHFFNQALMKGAIVPPNPRKGNDNGPGEPQKGLANQSLRRDSSVPGRG